MDLSSRPPSRSGGHHPWNLPAERFSSVPRTASQVSDHVVELAVKQETVAPSQHERSQLLYSNDAAAEIQHLRAQNQLLQTELSKKLTPVAKKDTAGSQDLASHRNQPGEDPAHATYSRQLAQQVLLGKVAELPTDLGFFLSGSVDLQHIKTTKSKLARMLAIFCPAISIPKAALKADLVQLYKVNVAPILAPFGPCSPSADHCETYCGQTWSYYASTEFNPNLRSSTRAILRAILKHFMPTISIAANAPKSHLISLYDQYVSGRDSQKQSSRDDRFTRIYAVAEAPGHLHLTCDDLRYRLQMAEPSLFIPRLAMKDTLVRLYELFVQMRDGEKGDPLEGHDYFWSDLKEF